MYATMSAYMQACIYVYVSVLPYLIAIYDMTFYGTDDVVRQHPTFVLSL